MQASGCLNDLFTGLEMQVIRVGEHHLSSSSAQLFSADSLHGAQGSHRHEAGGLDRPMWGVETSASGCRVIAARLDFKAEHGTDVFCRTYASPVGA